jgi:hypothetical protein
LRIEKAAFGSSYKGNLSPSRIQVELKDHAPGLRRVAVRHNKANITEYVAPFEVEVSFSEEAITLKPLKMDEEDLVEEQQLTAWKRGLLLLYKDGEPKARTDIASALGVKDGTAGNVMSKLRIENYAENAGNQVGNQQREIAITQAGVDYVEMFLASYREQQSTEDEVRKDDEEEEASSSSSTTKGERFVSLGRPDPRGRQCSSTLASRSTYFGAKAAMVTKQISRCPNAAVQCLKNGSSQGQVVEHPRGRGYKSAKVHYRGRIERRRQ